MKTLIGITCYPINDKQIKMLNDCIDSLKPLGFDIAVLSHYPVDLDIQKKVNYLIYDSENPLLPTESTPHNFVINSTFHAKIYNGGHALAITRNMNTLFKYSKMFDYDYCICIEFDCFFDVDDLNKIKECLVLLSNSNKKMLVFNPSDYLTASCHYGENGPYFCETCFFISEPNFFLNTVNPPTNIEEWNINGMCYNLETSFYEKLKDNKDDVLFMPTHSSEYFTKSSMNQHRYGLFDSDFIYNENDDEHPILFINNMTGIEKTVEVYQNQSLILKIDVQDHVWYYNIFSYDDSIIDIKIYESNILENEKKFILSEQNKESFKQKGTLFFK